MENATVTMPRFASEKQLRSACGYYDHGFGLLTDPEQAVIYRQAVVWYEAWRKVFEDEAQAHSQHQVGGTHYIDQVIQPWDAMRALMAPEQFHGFLFGNAIKYLARADHKGGIEDLQKARHYLDKLIEERNGPQRSE